jgi:O-antigen/teichoic acid export membrane protein
LPRRALRGSVLTVVAFGASNVLRFAANLLQTRLLMPEHFGLMTIVTGIVMGLHLFTDIGVGPSIVQSPRGEDPVFLNTAWTIQVIRGFGVWVVASLLAWPLAAFYGKPILATLLPVASLSGLIGGFASTRLHTENRRLAYGRVIAVELLSQMLSLAVLLLLAWVTHSVWALVVGGLTASLTRTLLSHVIVPGSPNRFAWEEPARRAIVAFGRWIFVSTAITFLATQSDRLLLGKLVTTERLGIYGIAANLAAIPTMMIGQLASKVFYPAVATALRQDTFDAAALRRTRIRLLLLLAPMMALAIAAVSPLLRAVYDHRYDAVGPLTALLLVGTWVGALSSSYSTILLAAGRPRMTSAGYAAKAAFFVAAVGLVAPRFGIAGVALVVSLSELGMLAVSMIGCRPLRVVSLGADLGITALGAACLLAFLQLRQLLGLGA